MRRNDEYVDGHISSAQFGGHRFVVGHWPISPIGPMGDVMWRRLDGTRVLLAPSDEAADYISGIYDFDEVDVAPLRVDSDGRVTTVASARLSITLAGGRLRPVPVPRPRWFTKLVEAPIAQALMGVHAVGTSPTGVREWYQTRGWRWVRTGSATLDGVDLGPPQHFTGAVGVGFSEPPPRPSVVTVRVSIERPGRYTT